MWTEDGPELALVPDGPVGPADPKPRAAAEPEAADDVGPDEADAGPGGTTGRGNGRCGLLALGAALGIPGAFMVGDFDGP